MRLRNDKLKLLSHIPDGLTFEPFASWLGACQGEAIGRYLRLQVIAAQAHATISPWDFYVTSDDPVPGLVRKGDGICTVWRGRGASISRLSVSGNQRVSIWVDEGAKIGDVQINTVRSDLDIIFGPHCEFTSTIIQSTSGTGAVVIGGGTTLTKANFYLSEGLTYIAIGDDCMFSNDVAIRTSDSHAIYDLDTGRRFNHSSSVVIQEHSWISRRASLNKGVRVGPDVVLGQEAVAAGRMNANSIYAGNPAKLVRTNTTWDRTHAETIEAARDIKPDRVRQRNFIAATKAIRERPVVTGTGADFPRWLSSALASGQPVAIPQEHASVAESALSLRDFLRAQRY